MKFFTRTRILITTFMTSLFAMIGNAFASTPTGIDAIFGAFDISSLSGLIQTILIGFVGVNMLFVGYKYLKRTWSRG